MSRVKLPQLLFNGTLHSTRHNYIVTNLMNKKTFQSKTNHPLANRSGWGCPQVNKTGPGVPKQIHLNRSGLGPRGWGGPQGGWGPQVKKSEQVNITWTPVNRQNDRHDGKHDANYMCG